MGELISHTIRGVTYYYIDDQLHSVDGRPAIVGERGRYWYYLDNLHRYGEPAIVSSELLAWYDHGQLHNDDGPAYVECTPMQSPDTVQFYYYGAPYTPSKVKI